MSFSGGVYTLDYSWVIQRNRGVAILPDQIDTQDNGFATGLSTLMCRDGQSTPTANIPFGSHGITGLADPVNPQDMANFRYVTARVKTAIFSGSIFGLTLSNDVGSPNLIIDIAAGMAVADDGLSIGILPAFTKSLAAFAVGRGNGGLDFSSLVVSNTWYYIFLIGNPIAQTVDVLISQSATAPTLPVNFTKKRRIGAIKTDSFANIIPFSQNGDEFLWKFPTLDMNGLALATTPTLYPFNVPIGIVVYALLFGSAGTSSSQTIVLFNSTAETQVNPPTHANMNTVASTSLKSIGPLRIRTDTNASIRGIAAAGSTAFINLSTYGWIDSRGK